MLELSTGSLQGKVLLETLRKWLKQRLEGGEREDGKTLAEEDSATDLTEVHFDYNILSCHVRKEDATFDLLLVKCEGHSEVSTISSKRDAGR